VAWSTLNAFDIDVIKLCHVPQEVRVCAAVCTIHTYIQYMQKYLLTMCAHAFLYVCLMQWKLSIMKSFIGISTVHKLSILVVLVCVLVWKLIWLL
jgi:hypothetical protein